MSNAEHIEHETNDDGGTRVVIPEHIETKNTDGRGRFTLGTAYANRRVTLAVVESEPLDAE